MDTIKVSARSHSVSVAGAMAGTIRESGRADVQTIDAGSVDQAIKAIAIAGEYLAMDGFDIACIALFADVDVEGQERTGVRIVGERR